MIKDIEEEIKTGQPTEKHYLKQVKPARLFYMTLQLFKNMVMCNFGYIAYICMILTAVINPGILTLIYPLSVFGYALFEETRPPPRYWFFMMGYTQLLLIIEFLLSLNFWKSYDFYADLTTFLSKYYIGLFVTEG